MAQMHFKVDGNDKAFDIQRLVIAGWTGRNHEAVEHHIKELEAIGVKRPRTVPCFYRLSANLLTSDTGLEMVGTDSSGEAEFVLISTADGLYVGVGSDHTDRKVEAYGVTVSKQMCAKPVSSELWRFADVEAHWDQLMLRSYVTRAGKRSLYQEGPVSKMLAPRDLISKFPDSPGTLPVGTAMYCGTLVVLGEIGGGERFEVELVDPVKNRTLRHGYDCHSLAIAD